MSTYQNSVSLFTCRPRVSQRFYSPFPEYPRFYFKNFKIVLKTINRVRTNSKNCDLQRPNSRVFPDSQNSFSRTFRINSVHKHGCIRSKKCTYQITYGCNCITVTVFLKFKLTQKVTNCTQHFTMNFFSSSLEVKCGISSLQRKRGSNGVWFLQRN